MAFNKNKRRMKVRRRVRKKIRGTAERPRLSVYRSNKSIYGQIIDDISGTTLVSASSAEEDAAKEGTRKEIARSVGKLLGERAKAQNIESVIFDRSGYLYHGRVKELADGAREAGLQF